jgi:hypothetical protein
VKSVTSQFNLISKVYFQSKKNFAKMSSAFELLKNSCENTAISNNNNNTKIYKNFDQLVPGEYAIEKFRIVDTKYGPKIQAVGGDFYVFLPSRFSAQSLNQTMIDELNQARYVMIYKGKDNNTAQLDFKRE